MLEISKTWITINCPKCNYSVEVQLQDAELESSIYCHNCKQTIRIIDKDASLFRGIESIENAFEELNNTLNNLFK